MRKVRDRRRLLFVDRLQHMHTMPSLSFNAIQEYSKEEGSIFKTKIDPIKELTAKVDELTAESAATIRPGEPVFSEQGDSHKRQTLRLPTVC